MSVTSHYLRESCTFTEAASTAGMVWQKVVVVLKPFQTVLYLETNSQPLTTREGAKFKNLAAWIFYVLVGKKEILLDHLENFKFTKPFF